MASEGCPCVEECTTVTLPPRKQAAKGIDTVFPLLPWELLLGRPIWKPENRGAPLTRSREDKPPGTQSRVGKGGQWDGGANRDSV